MPLPPSIRLALGALAAAAMESDFNNGRADLVNKPNAQDECHGEIADRRRFEREKFARSQRPASASQSCEKPPINFSVLRNSSG
jgi:hypothetical protein